MSKRNKNPLASRITLSGKRKMKKILFNKKAVSVVVSTLVLTAGVLAMGIGVLYWAYSWGNLATRAYSTSEANNAKAVQERLGFEHTDFTNNILAISLINWGDANNVTITNVFIWDSAHQPFAEFINPQLRNITTNAIISGLNMGDEGYLRISPPRLADNSLYYIRLVTARGRTFDSTFATP
jgi:hypothetical protein